jgi:hypothetical protein
MKRPQVFPPGLKERPSGGRPTASLRFDAMIDPISAALLLVRERYNFLPLGRTRLSVEKPGIENLSKKFGPSALGGGLEGPRLSMEGNCHRGLLAC